MARVRLFTTNVRGLLLVILLPLFGCATLFEPERSYERSDFEKMLVGFPSCKFDGVYLDLITKAPVHKYFVARNLEPNEVKGEFAIFMLKEKFYDIDVHKMLIPASTYSVHALYLQGSVAEVKKKLDRHFPLGFYSRAEEGNGDRPVLIAYPDNSNWSVLVCTSKEN